MASDPISWLGEQFDKVSQHPGMRTTVDRLKGLAGSAADKAGGLFNYAKANTPDLVEAAKGKISDSVNYLRGASATPPASTATPPGQPLPEMAPTPTANIGETIAQAAKGSNLTEAEVMNPSLRNAQPAINQTVSQVAGETNALRTPQVAQPVKPVMPNIAGTNPTNAIEGPFTAKGEVGAKPVNPTAYEAGKDVAKGLRRYGKIGGVVAPASELLDPNVRGALDPTSDMSTKDRLKQGARSAIRVGGGILGGALGGALGGGFGAIPGGAAGYMLGDKAANFLVGEAPQATNTGQAQAAPIQPVNMRGTVAQPSQEQVQSGSIQTDQGPQTPQQLLRGTAVPASGSGAFQRTGGQARSVTPQRNAFEQQANSEFGEAARMHAVNSVDSGGGNLRNVEALAKQGPMGALAALGAFGAGGRAQAAETNLGLKKNAQSLAYAKTAYDIAKDQRDAKLRQAEFDTKQADTNRKTFDDDITTNATVLAGPQGTIEGKDAYANRVKQTQAGLKTDINYSVGNRTDSKKYEDLKPAEREQLFLAKKFKDKATDARSGVLQSMRDFFGNKRFDSKDLYSYIPDSVEPSSLPGGYVVKLRNGNTAQVTALQGGGFQMVGANDPIDADMSAIIQSKIKAHKEQQNKSAKPTPTIATRG